MPVLDNAAIKQALMDLPGWEHTDGHLTRTWERKGFLGVVNLFNAVAFVANEAKHHPDISVHDYNQLTVSLTTHSEGGVTEADVQVARRISGLLPDS